MKLSLAIYFKTRSLGALRAQTSSLRPFGPPWLRPSRPSGAQAVWPTQMCTRCMYPRCMYPWYVSMMHVSMMLVTIKRVGMMHISLMHVSRMHISMYPWCIYACIHKANIHDPWPGCMYLLYVFFLLPSVIDGRTDEQGDSRSRI